MPVVAAAGCRQRRDGRWRHVEAIHFEVPAQVGARVAAAVAVGAQHGVVHRHVGADVAGGDDGRALAALEQPGNAGLARNLASGWNRLWRTAPWSINPYPDLSLAEDGECLAQRKRYIRFAMTSKGVNKKDLPRFLCSYRR